MKPFRVLLDTPPVAPRHGEPFGYVSRKQNRERHELALTMAWICDRALFGRTYSALQPDYFWTMPQDSGVLLRPMATTARLIRGATKPGDIDLLIIPYHGRELILDRAMAIEIKAIRASYAKQGKSPNEFGFSQAEGLSTLGFPHVALAHLIISDGAPEHEWRMMGVARVLDQDGRVELLSPQPHDMLPAELMSRAFGRLCANSRNLSHGLASVYLMEWSEEDGHFAPGNGYWMPKCRPAQVNPQCSEKFLESLAGYYVRNKDSFLVTPRFDPPS